MTAGDGTRAARFFQALGDPTRLALLEELRGGARNVGELVEALGCPQPKVSRHLKVLKEAGLVRDRRDGRNVAYERAASSAWPAAARAWVVRLAAARTAAESRTVERARPDARGAGPGAATAPGRSSPLPAPPPAARPTDRPARRPAAPPGSLEAHLL